MPVRRRRALAEAAGIRACRRRVSAPAEIAWLSWLFAPISRVPPLFTVIAAAPVRAGPPERASSRVPPLTVVVPPLAVGGGQGLSPTAGLDQIDRAGVS